MGWPIFANVSAGQDLGLTKPSFGLTHFFQCFCWAGLGLGLGWAIFSTVSVGLDLGLIKPWVWGPPIFPFFLLSWTWVGFGLSHFFQCFSWARLGLEQAQFWAKPFYQYVCILGLGLWRLLRCAHVSKMTLWADLRRRVWPRTQTSGPLDHQYHVGMVEVGTFAF